MTFCMLGQGFVAGYETTTPSMGGLVIDVTSEDHDQPHGTITAQFDCVDVQAHTYLGAVATMKDDEDHVLSQRTSVSTNAGSLITQ